MNNVSVSTAKVLLINKDIVKEYYECVRASCFGEYEAMKQFQKKYPLQYSRFQAVHRKRTRIKSCIGAMKIVSNEIYFGTLTFNDSKNENKRSTKRKEAFKKLNALCEYVVLIEEFGEKNGRYHIHFIATLKKGENFHSFRRIWHSRQNLRLLQDNENVAQYMCKYLSKDLPRVRCNKPLVALEKAYKRGVVMERDKFYDLGTKYQVQKTHSLNVFDLLED